MAEFKLEAQLREQTGRNASRRLRRAGRVPAIVYGGEKSDLPVTLNANVIGKLLNIEAFHTSILNLRVEGQKGDERVLLKDVQWDPISDEAVHLDFLRVRDADIVHLEVPVVAVNYEKCPGVVKGGKLDIVRHVLEVACRADSIPEHIEIDCRDLDLGATVHIDDVALPEGVSVPHEVNFTVLNLSAVRGGKLSEAEEDAAEEG